MARNATARRSSGAGPQDHYQAVTDRIVVALEAGTAPWRRPWVLGARSVSWLDTEQWLAEQVACASEVRVLQCSVLTETEWHGPSRHLAARTVPDAADQG